MHGDCVASAQDALECGLACEHMVFRVRCNGGAHRWHSSDLRVFKNFFSFFQKIVDMVF